MSTAAAHAEFLADVVEGLRREPKELPCKYFYDARGSRLFDRICELPEYYPTRAEMAIMQGHAGEMAALLGPRCYLVEFGSGSSLKTRLLLDRLEDPVAYVPVDISAEHLLKTSRDLAAAYPSIPILPLAADYTEELSLPEPPRPPSRRAVYFPGSTIGNLHPARAEALLARVARIADALLIGIDVKKDPAVIEAAYNDAGGVTAEFNRNLLRRIRDELDADLEPEAFDHRAIYDEARGRIEMHLVSRREQTVHVAGERIRFRAGESILTECSYKYEPDDFAALALRAGLTLTRSWLHPLFAVQMYSVPDRRS